MHRHRQPSKQHDKLTLNQTKKMNLENISIQELSKPSTNLLLTNHEWGEIRPVVRPQTHDAFLSPNGWQLWLREEQSENYYVVCSPVRTHHRSGIPMNLPDSFPIRLESGKRYVTRNGGITDKIVTASENCEFLHSAMVNGSIATWRAGGAWSPFNGAESPLDIVSEYVELLSASDILRLEADRIGGVRDSKPIEIDLRWAYSISAALLDAVNDKDRIVKYQPN